MSDTRTCRRALNRAFLAARRDTPGECTRTSRSILSTTSRIRAYGSNPAVAGLIPTAWRSIWPARKWSH
jgi:hypothetical protein